MPAAKGRKVVQILAALAVLAGVALPAGASIPRTGQLPGPNPEALLAAAREAPAPQPTANSQDASFELFTEPAGDRFRLDLQTAADAPAQARFHLLTPPKTRVRGFRLPEPLVIGVELPPSRTAFRLYGDVPYGFASGGLYVTSDPLGYVDGPNLYQYGLNNPVSNSDALGLFCPECNPSFARVVTDPQVKEDLRRDAANYRLWWKSVAMETLDLPNRIGKGLLNLGPSLGRLALKVSDAGQAALWCVSGPGECAGELKDKARRLPGKLGAAWEELKNAPAGAWNEWVNMSDEEHIRQWAGITVDTAAGFGVGELLAPGFTPRTGTPLLPKGLPEGARYAQRTFSSMFSDEGLFAGLTVDDVAAALRSGELSSSQVPINYVVREGNTLILNTRSAQALEAAGIPRSQWNVVNQTGNQFFEDLLTGQLRRNRLTSEGTPTVRRSGG